MIFNDMKMYSNTSSEIDIDVVWPMGLTCYVSQGDSEFYTFASSEYPSGRATITTTQDGLWSAYATAGYSFGRYYGATGITSGNRSLDILTSTITNVGSMYIIAGDSYHGSESSTTTLAISDIPYAVHEDPVHIVHNQRYYGLNFEQNGFGYVGFYGYKIYHIPRYSLHKVVVEYENIGPYQNGDVDSCLSVCIISDTDLDRTNPYRVVIPVESLVPLTGKTGRMEFDLDDYKDPGSSASDIWALAINRGNAAGYIKSFYELRRE